MFVAMVSGERASETKQDDASTRLEGAEINKSLLALKASRPGWWLVTIWRLSAMWLVLPT